MASDRAELSALERGADSQECRQGRSSETSVQSWSVSQAVVLLATKTSLSARRAPVAAVTQAWSPPSHGPGARAGVPAVMYESAPQHQIEESSATAQTSQAPAASCVALGRFPTRWG